MRHRSGRPSAIFTALCLVGLALASTSFAGFGGVREPGAVQANVAAAQSGTWTLVHDRPIGGKYEDFAFPNRQHGWLVSAPGDILHTADAGVTWTVQASGLGPLRSVDFLDEKRGFAGTLQGQLYRTTDGGASWTDIAKELPRTAKGFCGMTHVGERVHIVGRYYGEATDYFYSPDGGKTWRGSDLGALAQGLVDVSFINESVGFIGGMAKSTPASVGPAIILKTVDGGTTWRPVYTHDGGRGFAWKIFPVTARLIYAALQSQDGIYRVAKSTDGGDNWDVQIVATGQPQGPGLQGIGFLDANTGWIGGFFQGMFTTSDGGKTWAPLPVIDRTINRFEKVGNTMFTASTRGILRYDAAGGSSTSQSLAAALSDREFWSLTEQFSEPNGYFRSNSGSPDNLLSNEGTVSTVAAALAQRVKPSGVYLGVGPEQNFTYIAASRPRIAVITDIRRGNLHLHLMYKALFEMSANRADFVARLFTRTRPPGLSAQSSAAALMNAYLAAEPGSDAVFQANLKAVQDHLTKTRNLPLSAEDLAGIEYVYRNFHEFGPAIHYTSTINGRSGTSYATLMRATDVATGEERTYLANEEAFGFVKAMQSKNMIVPIVGDFAGPRALRSVGAYLKARGAVVTAFYVSNVEDYLQRNGVWPAFCANVAALPLDAASVFIRPSSGRAGSFGAMAVETAGCAGRAGL